MIAPISDYLKRDKIPFEKMCLADHVDHITVVKLYGDMFAQRISVGEYGKQATPIGNQMIAESQQILRITGSKQ